MFSPIDNAFLMCKQHKLEDMTWQERDKDSHQLSLFIWNEHENTFIHHTGKIKLWDYLCSVSLHPKGLKGKCQHVACFSHLHLAIKHGEMSRNSKRDGKGTNFHATDGFILLSVERKSRTISKGASSMLSYTLNASSSELSDLIHHFWFHWRQHKANPQQIKT